MTRPAVEPARGIRLAGVRWIAGVLLTLALAAIGAVVFASPALAHDVLISSTPADKASLSTAPTTMTFTFDQPVQNFAPVIAVTGPDGKQYQSGSATVNGNTVSSAMGLGPTGTYTASYRIVSADGHPVTGQITFTLTAAGSGSGSTATVDVSSAAVATAQTSATGAAAATGGSGGLGAGIWIGIIIAVIVVAAAAVVLIRRPKAPTPSGRDPGQQGQSG